MLNNWCVDNKIDIVIIIIIIVVGLISRVVEFNSIILDKYLGDLLYAVMFFYIFKLLLSISTLYLALLTFILMMIFELIQLTGVTVFLREQEFIGFKLLAFLIGSEFSFVDILVYALGLVVVICIEKLQEFISFF